MHGWSRRQLLTTAALGTLGLATGACNEAESDSASGTLEWWDHYNQLQGLHKDTLAEFSASSEGIPTKYHFVQLTKFTQAIQLAKQSGQQPDVHSIPDLGYPTVLIDGGWIQPLELSDDVLSRFGENDLVEGIHRFDGKLYSFPIFTDRWHNGLLWYHKEMLDKMGVEPPTTFDEFRAACRLAGKLGDDVSGLVAGFKGRNPYFLKLNALAQAAGFPGDEGVEYRTGEYKYHHDGYVQVFELFDALRRDGSVFPAALSASAIQSRGRWSAGEGVFFFEGPFQVGSVKRDFSRALPGMALAGLITGDAATPPRAYRTYRPGQLYLAKSSKFAEQANELLGRFTTPEYYAGLAAAMDQPPPDLDVVATSSQTHPLYQELCASYAEEVFIGPSPVVANPDVAKVRLELKPPPMNLGEVFAKMMAGEITDYRKELVKLSGQYEARRDNAIKAAKQKGAEVSTDDYVFANWQPGQDYTVAMYGER